MGDLDVNAVARDLRKRLVRFGQVGDAERPIAVTAALLMPAVAVVMHRYGVARARVLAAQLVRRAPALRSDVPASRIAVLVRSTADAIGSVSPWPMTCLTRSVVLCALLEQRGERPILQLGVRRVPEALDAHAWVELDGVALLDPSPDGPEQTFVPLSTLPPPGPSRSSEEP